LRELDTPRLHIAPLTLDDAAFILELVNDPDWLRFIGDKHVHSIADAETYLRNGALAMYERHGVGLCRVDRRSDNAPVGMCGLIRREGLDDVDIGFAFLARYRGQGLACEAARATLNYGYCALGLTRIVAITSPANERSARLLEKIGLRFERMIRLSPQSAEVCLYAHSRNEAT
jgi:RimJ/RimL family protein N-acetyltransferase